MLSVIEEQLLRQPHLPLRHRSHEHDSGYSDSFQLINRIAHEPPIIGAPVCREDDALGSIATNRPEDEIINALTVLESRNGSAKEGRNRGCRALNNIVLPGERGLVPGIKLRGV